jgi:hypothetical protein
VNGEGEKDGDGWVGGALGWGGSWRGKGCLAFTGPRWGTEVAYYDRHMLRYHVAFCLPHTPGEMVVARGAGFSRCCDPRVLISKTRA